MTSILQKNGIQQCRRFMKARTFRRSIVSTSPFAAAACSSGSGTAIVPNSEIRAHTPLSQPFLSAYFQRHGHPFFMRIFNDTATQRFVLFFINPLIGIFVLQSGQHVGDSIKSCSSKNVPDTDKFTIALINTFPFAVRGVWCLWSTPTRPCLQLPGPSRSKGQKLD